MAANPKSPSSAAYPGALPARGVEPSGWALDTLFGPRKDDAWTAFVNKPDDASQWGGGRYRDLCDAIQTASGSGHYVCSTIIQPNATERSDETSEAGACLFFDNITEDSWLSNFCTLKPTFIVRTSEESYQYFYVFSRPVPMRIYKALVEALKADENTAGVLGGEHGDGYVLAGYGRLPSGINPKEGRNGFPTELVEAKGIKYTVDELAKGFGLDPDALRKGAVTLKSLVDNPNWVGWRQETRDGKPTKVPYDPRTGGRAKTDDPSTWTTYDGGATVGGGERGRRRRTDAQSSGVETRRRARSRHLPR